MLREEHLRKDKEELEELRRRFEDGGDGRVSGKVQLPVTEVCIQLIGERGQWSIVSLCSWVGKDDHANWEAHAGTLSSSVLKQIEKFVKEKNGVLVVESELGDVETKHVFITSGDYPVLCALSGEPDLISKGVKSHTRNEVSHGALLRGRDAFDTLESLGIRFGPTFSEDLQELNGLEHIDPKANLQEALLGSNWVSKYLDIEGATYAAHKPDGSWRGHIVLPRNKIFGRESGYPKKMTPGGVESIATDEMHAHPNIGKKLATKMYRRAVDDDKAKATYTSENGRSVKYSKRKATFLEVCADLKINLSESDQGERSKDGYYLKLNGRFNYDPMNTFFIHHREILETLKLDEDTHEIWRAYCNAILQKNNLVQKRRMSDEDKIMCAKWATKAMLTARKAWTKADFTLYIDMMAYQLDQNPCEAAAAYWDDGHYNGPLDTDPMIRAWTPAEIKVGPKLDPCITSAGFLFDVTNALVMGFLLNVLVFAMFTGRAYRKNAADSQ
ncbi:hypothetical protein CYMTET_48440 [Cymbomonas tetramitiformis]|uniref:Uncharacterized protein n=1 Tax=Cymbomonas tetramitiformis TaxID=36881 RepID=A0AAE0BS90_9CHLO|nr:hypothetical protein CYMTET_48440 [Cymbomonas tetramitiformis]